MPFFSILHFNDPSVILHSGCKMTAPLSQGSLGALFERPAEKCLEFARSFGESVNSYRAGARRAPLQYYRKVFRGCTAPKPPLCKGRWLAIGETEGLP